MTDVVDPTVQPGAGAGNSSTARPPSREAPSRTTTRPARRGREGQIRPDQAHGRDGAEYVRRDSLPADTGDSKPGDKAADKPSAHRR